MRKIAFLTSANMVGQADEAREDAYEYDLEFTLFARAASGRGLRLESVIWDARDIDWSCYDAVLVGTTWDYVQKRELFYTTLAQIDDQTHLFNPLSILQTNGDKGYLIDLAAKGIATIPTICVPKVTSATIAQAFATFGTTRLVAKPKIGAGAWRQALIQQNEPLPDEDQLPPGEAFLQPFLPDIQTSGELSLLFYDGAYSHGLRKTPKAGDYRIQSEYGGVEKPATPTALEMELAQKSLAALDEMPLYARVDIVPGLQGEPLLIELEMIEPYHYVEQGPDCGDMLMDALLMRLG